MGAIRALFIAAVVNCVTAPILIAAITIVSSDERILGKHKNGWLSVALGLTASGVMALAALGMLPAFLLA